MTSFDPAKGYPSAVPYARYRDPARAIGWLTAVLGARETLRVPMPDGRIGHAELAVGDHVIAVGMAPEGDVPVPAPADRAAVRAMTLVFVEDVDEAARLAVEHGGTLVDAPSDQPWGLRQAIVADPEGWAWEPSRFLREVALADWGAEPAPGATSA